MSLCIPTETLCTENSIWKTETNYTLYYPTTLIPVQFTEKELFIELQIGTPPIEDKCTKATPFTYFPVYAKFEDMRTNSTVVRISEDTTMKKLIQNNVSFYLQLSDVNRLQCIVGPSTPANPVPKEFTLLSGTKIDYTEPPNQPEDNGTIMGFGGGFLWGILAGFISLIIVGFLIMICWIRSRTFVRKEPELPKDGIAPSPFDQRIIPMEVVEEVGLETMERSTKVVQRYLENLDPDSEYLDPNEMINIANQSVEQAPTETDSEIIFKNII